MGFDDCMKSLIKKIFKPNPIKRFNKGIGERYNIGGGWGDRIEWCKKDHSIAGWKSRIPVEGDWLLTEMQSGREGLYQIKNVKPCKDPRDMFFADVEFVGYNERGNATYE